MKQNIPLSPFKQVLSRRAIPKRKLLLERGEREEMETSYQVKAGEEFKLCRPDDPLINLPEILDRGKGSDLFQTIFPGLGAGLWLALWSLVIPEDVGAGES